MSTLCYLELVSDTWKNRKKTNIIKWLMKQSDIRLEDMAEYLGCSVQYLNNKFTRDSFSIDDLIIAAHAAGYSLDLTYTAGGERQSARIGIADYFIDYDEEILRRLLSLKEKKHTDKREEYEALKAELERMKTEYGFED